MTEDRKAASHAQDKSRAVPPWHHWIPILLGAYAIAGGSVSLLGWVLNRQSFTDWFDLGISIQPNTTVAVTLAGLALVLLAAGRNRLAVIPGSIVGLIG